MTVIERVKMDRDQNGVNDATEILQWIVTEKKQTSHDQNGTSGRDQKVVNRP